MLDGFGNVMTVDTGSDASSITLSLQTPNAGGILSSATGPSGLTKKLVSGVATWTDLKISSPTSVYRLNADSTVNGIPDQLSLPINLTN